MDSSSISIQQAFWNGWNATHREHQISEVSIRQAEAVRGWLNRLGRRDLDILEVGCGAGWFCPQLAEFGSVTGTDLSDEVLARAQARAPHIQCRAGDFMQLDFGRATFDVIVSLEVLSHVADQPAFLSKISSHLRPGGLLMLATQNRPVLQHLNTVSSPAPGQLRKWLDRHELRQLLDEEFTVQELFSVTPKANRGIMRIINSRTFNRPVRAVFGNRVESLKEAMWLGWTLMALARKRVADQDHQRAPGTRREQAISEPNFA